MTSATATDRPAADPAGSIPCRIGARSVTKRFGTLTANSDIDLDVLPGSVHAVIGENGAGKTTLMRILYGLERPDEGDVLVDGRPVRLRGPRDAIARGIGLVQQELSVVPELTLLENLVLGAEPTFAGRIQWSTAREQGERLARDAGLSIDWDTGAMHTSVAVQQQVEILRLLYRGADVLILDEPTAVLAPAQVTELLAMLRQLRNAGRTIVFISHKLAEVVSVADRVTVLRAGRAVAHLEHDEIDADRLAAQIIGDNEQPVASEAGGQPGEVVLAVENLTVRDDRGLVRVDGVGFDIRAGEVVGFAAVAGNGQDELAEALAGIRRCRSGAIRLGGADMAGDDVRARRKAGLRYVSPDRKREGLALQLSLRDNAIATPDLSTISRWGLLSAKRARSRTSEILRSADVRFGTIADPASSLSGGNQQRVVIGRETNGSARVLVASQPTRGVDVRGVAYISELIRRARRDGTGVVLFSEELDELRDLCDRILVLHGGRLVGELPRGATRAEIGRLMLGGQAATDEARTA